MRSRFLWIACVSVAVTFSGCRRAVPTVNEVVAVTAKEVPLAPDHALWDNAPEHVAKLMLQDLVEPRLMKASTPEVRVQAITNGTDVAFRLRWNDGEQNDKPGPSQFVDACAVQIPRKIESDAPDPQMGQSERPVDIVYWRADWQASVNGRGDELRDLHPNASIDHYPYEARSLEKGSTAQKEMARRYSPAQASGNRRAGPRDSPVESLVAEGPGTLSPSPGMHVKGHGARTKEGWTVVLSRRLPDGLAAPARTQIAFAVWEGSQKESGARKMRTGWVPLSVRPSK